MIELINVSKIYPGLDVPAVNNVSFKVKTGEILAIVGPSGCGKTTILKMINRLVVPTYGEILIHGQDTTNVNHDVLRRKIGYVIQQIGLLPHRKVKDNVAIVPRMLGWSEKLIHERVHTLLEMNGLNPEEVKDKYPYQLSGGQMQRVGVARALAGDPPIMLMDEPFGAVDPIVRKHLQDEFLKLQQNVQKTIVFVTHDIDEAMKMGDQVAVVKDGVIVQKAPPLELLSRPKNEFVIDLIGQNRGVRILDLIQVKHLTIHDSNSSLQSEEYVIPSDQPIKAALEKMMTLNSDTLSVIHQQKIIGVITWESIKSHIHSMSRDPHTLKNVPGGD